MASLVAKYDFLENLTKKVVLTQHEPRKREYVPYKGKSSEDGPSKKKKKNKQKNTHGSQIQVAPKLGNIFDASVDQRKTNDVKAQKSLTKSSKPSKDVDSTKIFSARDLLLQRLHQKIEESRGLDVTIDPSSEEVKKRREKRKQERERKKRKKKEFKAKKLAEQAAVENGGNQEDVPVVPTAPSGKPIQKDTDTLVFSKVEVGEDYVEKPTRIKEKRKQVKGGLTPLTGKNYKQLLSRVQARKAKLEELKEKDPAKALREEEKMKWTNLLYKAEGVKIKDNEEMLKASLKKKEKRKSQIKKKWNQRSQHVLEKMQNRQDKRRRNLQKRKQGKIDKRKQKARKKGRILPEDLKKAVI